MKKFVTHNKADIDTSGTFLVGTVNVTYQKLCKVFGKPFGSDGYKSDAEWEVEFADGTVATIYNWKDGKNYNGRSGTPKTKITDWHIGGKDEKAVELVKEALS